MRKISTLFLSLLIVTFAFGKSVTIEKANQVANNYFAQYSGKSSQGIENSFSKSLNGIVTYYVFNYTGGGFVVVSADDAATPVLAQSNEGFIENEVSNPSVKFMLDTYSEEIAHLVTIDADNSAAAAEWNSILNNETTDASTQDVAPLCTTTWDQNTWYNYYCPAAAGGPGGKAWAGCVATAMGQVMKYHNFPVTGVGSHTYDHPLGPQTANFGATNYNFADMGIKATSASYQEIATLLFHAGVSVNMDYAAEASGAFSADVPWAMGTYFNYDLSTIAYNPKTNYSNATWIAFLKSELDASRPLYYSGSGTLGGHAWVCDGYRNSDSKFHMNFGWSGASNGYFSVTANIVAGGYTFTTSTFAVVSGIQPGNPDLIVRVMDLNENNFIPHGPDFNIHCSVVTGTPTAVNLYIDDQLVFNTTQTDFTYTWQTSSESFATHTIRVEATDGTNTVSHKVNAQLSEWKPQASGFTEASRGVKYLHAVDSLVAWGTAYNGADLTDVIQEFTKTVDGGNTWVMGKVNGTVGLEPSMVFALSKDTAYIPMYRTEGSLPMGIYQTKNGGTTWTRQSTASFSNTASFPNVVHFFDKNNGFCMGDPINGEFEIYTTTNGGTNWTAVAGANIPDPIASDEYGTVGFYSAVGDKVWFGTTKGRVFRSSDKGLHWEENTASLGVKSVDVTFADELHGIAQDKSSGTVGDICETLDGGITWTNVTVTGVIGSTDLSFVPGTENTWVSVESDPALPTMGAFYSFDGGHSWAQGGGTETNQFLSVDFVNNHCGWAGTFSQNATTGGMFKYIGLLEPGSILNPVTTLVAQPSDNSVQLTWTAPVTAPLSYNVYRNDTLLVNTPSALYTDVPVANGQQYYCVTAVYDLGESPRTCTTAWITVGVPNTDEAAYRVYPNPANEIINVVTPVKFNEVRMINNLGKVVYRNNNKGTNLQILTEGFDPGVYFLQIYTGTQVISKKVSITR